jgi:hypothetical protein
MTNTLTLIQLLCLTLLLVAVPVYEFLKLKWRAEAAERMLRSERLRRTGLERELEQLQHVVRDLQRSASAPVTLSVASDASQRIAQNLSEDTITPKTVTA